MLRAPGSSGAQHRLRRGHDSGTEGAPEAGDLIQRAKASDTGRIRTGDLERGVNFAEPAPGVRASIDATYHAKYDSYCRRSWEESSVPRLSP
jgi:hypothetical protein